MKCSNCQSIYEGVFCPKCGAKNIDEKQAVNFSKFNSILASNNEKIQAILGSGVGHTFLATGELKKGFAILSDKRIYFKGKCFIKKGGIYLLQREERVVDVKDVTGTGFVYNNPIWMIILGVVLLAIGMLLISLAGNGIIHPILVLLSLLLFPIGILMCFMYRECKTTIFQISFAGGIIGFNTFYVPKYEAELFQKRIREIKDSIEEGKIVVAEKSQNSIPEELKKYKELLDGGIITQEEFDAKKKQLLGL